MAEPTVEPDQDAADNAPAAPILLDSDAGDSNAPDQADPDTTPLQQRRLAIAQHVHAQGQIFLRLAYLLRAFPRMSPQGREVALGRTIALVQEMVARSDCGRLARRCYPRLFFTRGEWSAV